MTEESVVLSAPNGHWRNHWMDVPLRQNFRRHHHPGWGSLPCRWRNGS